MDEIENRIQETKVSRDIESMIGMAKQFRDRSVSKEHYERLQNVIDYLNRVLIETIIEEETDGRVQEG